MKFLGFVLLAVIVAAVMAGVGVVKWRENSSPMDTTKEDQPSATTIEAQHAGNAEPGDKLMSGLAGSLHEGDLVFVGEYLGGTGCAHVGVLMLPAQGAFRVERVLKGNPQVQKDDLVVGEFVGCLPTAFSPYFQPIKVIVIGRWQGALEPLPDVGPTALPVQTRGQMHAMWIADLVSYTERNERQIVQMLTCREAHQIFWVGQPPGTARVVVDPPEPPQGTSVAFSFCITEEDFDPAFGEVEVWNYVLHDFGFQGKEGGHISGVAMRNAFNIPPYYAFQEPRADGLWIWAFGTTGGLGGRRYFDLILPRGLYKPYLSDQDVYVFSQKNFNIDPAWYLQAKRAGIPLEWWEENGKPVDILRGALWIPKPK